MNRKENRPEILKSGERARLLPLLSESNKEQRMTSTLLASMEMLPPFANALLSSIGQKVGKRTVIRTFTEVEFVDNPSKRDDRPDGLLTLRSGSRRWLALFEVKEGSNELDPRQVTRYLRLANNYNVNAVITISNEFAVRPDHHPLAEAKKIDGRLLRTVKLYHWSWAWIFTQAVLLEISDNPDQARLLTELVDFLDPRSSSGVRHFDQMNQSWKDFVSKLKTEVNPSKDDRLVQETVASWHEEERDLCLHLARGLAGAIHENVSIKLPRKYRHEPHKRFQDDCARLANDKILQCALAVPNAAADLLVQVNIAKRTICCSMQVPASDHATTKGRVNWLLRQIPKARDEGLWVVAVWPSKATDTEQPLSKIRPPSRKKTYPERLQTKNRKLAPAAFKVQLVRSLDGHFSGRRKFIEALEEAVETFYREVGQYLRAPRPNPPKFQKAGTSAGTTEEDTGVASRASVG